MGYENLSLIPRAEWYHRNHPCDGSRKTVNGEEGQAATGGGRVGRAILIHLTNSLSMRYTERLPCAAAARTRSTYPGGTPAISAAWHPCGLIYGRALTSLGPHQPRRGGGAGRCGSTRALRLRRSAGVMGVAKNLSAGMAKKRKRGRVISARSTVAKMPLDFARSAIKQRALLRNWA